MTCGCGYQFAFDPKRDGMTDARFTAALRAVSANGTYYFTLNGLHAELCRRPGKGPLAPMIVSGVTLAIGAFVIFSEGPLFLAIILGVVSLLSALRAAYVVFHNKAWYSMSQVEKFVHSFGGEPQRQYLDKLLLTPDMHQPPPDWPEPDIYDYGVERLLIVERDLMVDLLVRNGFHAEHNTLVLSESGYPSYLVPRAVKALEENPEMPVHLLHDATAHGAAMAERLRDSRLLPIEGRPLVDLGLNMQDVRRMKGMQAIGADKWDQGVPVDTLRFGTLGLGVGLALAEQQSLGELLEMAENQGKKGADDGGSSSGFG
ncbi:MAG: hypothetical protein RIC55_33200 [Pirellulaceae bacterium]